MQEDTSNGYIFISHSHKDIEKVRQIRNDMENAGFDPLCFYLKCLTDEDEIEGLIKREIDSRELFVYIDSPNSRASNWVKKEREYIDSLEDKKTLTIHLERYDSMEEISKALIRGLRVFISYSHRDAVLAFNLEERLKKKEFQVLMDRGIHYGSNMDEMIADMIVEASKCGAFIAIITENSVKSANFNDEIRYARKNNAKIIPIVIGEVELNPRLEMILLENTPIAIDIPLEKCQKTGLLSFDDMKIDDDEFNESIDYIVDEIWNALKDSLR